MKLARAWALTLLPALAAAGPAKPATPDADVVVHLTGIPNARGQVRVAVCTEAHFLQLHCGHVASTAAATGTMTIRVRGVPPGIYAVQAWHDANNNKAIDRNWMGMPTEALGFSRDAPMRFGPPRFADAAIRIGPDGAEITLALHSH